MKTWLNNLKVALAEENETALAQLFEKKIPNGTIEELKQAEILTNEALSLMETKKNQLAENIKKLKLAQEFLKA